MNSISKYSPDLMAKQATTNDIKKHFHDLSADHSLAYILDALPESVIILNKFRQVVYINKVCLETFGLNKREIACGLLPGELFNCNHSNETVGGCGTTDHCNYCGANAVIIASQFEKTEIKECRITRQDTGLAIDLRVKAAPYKIGEETFTLFSILNVSDEKRREVLQQVFFHDILNTVSGLRGFTELLLDSESDEDDEIKNVIFALSEQLSAEITSQQQLVAAENGTLHVSLEIISSIDLINSVIPLFKLVSVSKNKSIIVDENSEDIPFKSDRSLISRVLRNLCKNALEASEEGQDIQIGCRQVGTNIEFFINNKTVMSDSIKYQVFQRSFSTKGAGRGLGTYSVKLFTEKYLNGRVHFISNDKFGTTFYASYPIS